MSLFWVHDNKMFAEHAIYCLRQLYFTLEFANMFVG